MSRTIRRTNFEKVQQSRKSHNSGQSYGGFYTTWDEFRMTGNGHSGFPVFRPMTKQERNRRYWEIHGESKHSNAYGPNRYYRNKAERKSRQYNKAELLKAQNDPEYEIMPLSRYAYECGYSWW